MKRGMHKTYGSKRKGANMKKAGMTKGGYGSGLAAAMKGMGLGKKGRGTK